MPMLDHPDESTNAQSMSSADSDQKGGKKDDKNSEDNGTGGGKQAPVSMPSLDDDNDGHDEHQQQTQQQQHQQQQEQHQQQDKDKETHSDSEEHKSSDAADGTEKEDGADASNTTQHRNDDVTDANADNADQGTHEEQSEDHGGDEATSEQMAAAAAAGDHQVTMELDEAMQAQVEGGQIKFILNENGHLLQLDNHIITDSEGNQILVQDPEQIQQLLQSVGVLHSGDGLDGETLQMMTDGNGQMVLVQGDNNETQLIDASLLNADGQLVIQQGQDGDLGEGAHVIGEDGTRIPVSVSYTADGQPIVQVQQQVLETSEGQQILLDKDGTSAANTNEGAEEEEEEAAAGGESTGGFFALEDLMQQPSSDGGANAKEAE